MDKCKKEKENIYKTTCKDCEYNVNCENVTKREVRNNERYWRKDFKITRGRY